MLRDQRQSRTSDQMQGRPRVDRLLGDASQLNCLPQDMIHWGHEILPRVASGLLDQGIERPIVFTVEPLEDANRKFVRRYLKDSVGVFTDLLPHAPDFGIQSGLDTCIRLGAQSIVAHGGGSVLDAAKAVSYLHHKRKGRYLPIAAFPTTLSGSEFSHYFGITETNKSQKFKRSYADRFTVPRIVALDPVLLLDTPRALLLSSAIKGIDHAVEGMRRVGVDHPHAIMAAKGVERFFAMLRKWPKEIETRQAITIGSITMEDLLQLQLASWQSYFYPASVVYGLSHRIGHILGGSFDLPHSMTSCITLAPVIRACAAFYGAKLEVFAAGQGKDAAFDLAEDIEITVASLGLPCRITSFDFDGSRIGEVADLLRRNYRDEVNDLGEDADRKLDQLLESLL